MMAVAAANGVPVDFSDFESSGTSKETFKRAEQVHRSGNTKVIEEVKSGKLSASKAARIVSGREPRDDSHLVDEGGSSKPKKAMAASSKVDTKSSAPARKGRPQGDRRKNALLKGIRQIVQCASIEKDVSEVSKLFPSDGEEIDLLDEAIDCLKALRAKIVERSKPQQKRPRRDI